MPRLFISAREIQLINDWSKEIIKDMIGQKIYYYAVSTLKTKVDGVYNEARKKIFENPVTIPAIIGQPKWETKHNNFGMEQTATIELFIQTRELIDRKLTLSEGDFFTYGDAAFEVVSLLHMNNIFGQEEYEVCYKVIGNLARPGQFDPKGYLKPTKDSKDFETSGVQKTFNQSRGLPENAEGLTGDYREVRERLKDDMAPIALGEGPRTVDTLSETEDKEKANSFNNDPLPALKSFYEE